MRVPGHKCTLEHNGERSREESAWTATCACGDFQESHSTKEGAAQEYRWHLQRAKQRYDAEKAAGPKARRDAVDARFEQIQQENWLETTANAIVNSLPSLREFMRDNTNVHAAAREIVADIEESTTVTMHDKLLLAALSMHELMTRTS